MYTFDRPYHSVHCSLPTCSYSQPKTVPSGKWYVSSDLCIPACKWIASIARMCSSVRVVNCKVLYVQNAEITTQNSYADIRNHSAFILAFRRGDRPSLDSPTQNDLCRRHRLNNSTCNVISEMEQPRKLNMLNLRAYLVTGNIFWPDSIKHLDDIKCPWHWTHMILTALCIILWNHKFLWKLHMILYLSQTTVQQRPQGQEGKCSGQRKI